MAFLVPMLFGIISLGPYAEVSADCLGTLMERRVEVQYLVEETSPYVERLEQLHDHDDVNRFHNSEHMLNMMFYKIIPLGYKDYLISRYTTFHHTTAHFGCAVYGTTIVEVKSEKDVRNIVESIRHLPQYLCFVIALYDFKGENNWEHAPGKKAYYTKFAVEPNVLPSGDKRCVVITRSSNWTMVEMGCRLSKYCHFVCEMSKS